jgi:hypothetical protein
LEISEYIGDHHQHRAFNNRLIYGAIAVNIPCITFLPRHLQLHDSFYGEPEKWTQDVCPYKVPEKGGCR